MKKPYTWNRPPNAFPDGYEGRAMCRGKGDARQLTDDELADHCWWDKRTVGWWGDQRVDITVDLSKETPVHAIAVHVSSEKEGWRVPRKTLIFSSNDGKHFHWAGEITSDEALMQWEESKDKGKQDGNPHGWIMKTNLRTKGRYIILSFWATSLYLDEIRIYSLGQKTESISLPKQEILNSIDLYPFVTFSKLHVAKEICLPVALVLPEKIQYKFNDGLSLYLDLPKGILLKSPLPVSPVEEIAEGDTTWMRYKLQKARVLFLQSQLPVGTIRKTRIIAWDTRKNTAGQTQRLDIETISIPPVPLSTRLRTSVGFAPFIHWQAWPNVVEQYKHLGLTVFLPFSEMDLKRYFIQDDADKEKVRALIQEGKNAGLIVGAWSSPFCNGSLLRHRKNASNAVFLGSNTSSSIPCPRTYLQPHGEVFDPEGEVAQAAAAAANGVEFFLFDSEPHWEGMICNCPECRNAWKTFLEKHHIPFRDMKDIWAHRDNTSESDQRYARWLQRFWDAFYIRLWGTFRSRMNQSAPKGSTISLGIYNYPTKSSECTKSLFLGNHGRFLPLYKEKILSFAAPENYLVRTCAYGSLIRRLHRNLPSSCPLYPIVSCGAAGMIAWERSAVDLKHRLYEIFCNGGQGFHAWSLSGASGEDFRAIADVLRAIHPYENLIVNGHPIRRGAFAEEDHSLHVHGIANGTEALVLISRYGKKEPRTFEIRIQNEILGFNVTKLTPLDPSEGVRLNENYIIVEFNETSEDSVKVVHLK